MKSIKSNARRFWTVTAICCGITALFLLLTWDRKEYEPLQKLEFFSRDLRAMFGQKAPLDPRLVYIGINRNEYSQFTDAEIQEAPSLKLLRKVYPWSRTVWADLVQRLADAGAKVIVVDLVFGGERDGDEALRQVLNKYKDRVVVACNISDLNGRGDTQTLDFPSPTVLDGSVTNATGNDDRAGFDNVWPDWDGVLRKAQYRLVGSRDMLLLPTGVALESLDAMALRKFGAASQIPAGAEPIRFRYGGRAGTFRSISLDYVMSPRTWRANFDNGKFFRDKIVMIGPASDIFQDQHKTPFADKTIGSVTYSSMMYGPEVHLNLINAALNGAFLRDVSPRTNSLVILLSGLIAVALSFLVRQPIRRFVVILLLAIFYWYWGQWMFDHANLVVPEASPLLVLVTSGIVVLGYDYFAEQLEKSRIRKTLERYVSKNVVKELLDNPATYLDSLGGRRRSVTVLFCDLRNFTSMTENSRETRLFRNLNEYFDEMTKHVFAHDGTLDKFIGDAIMAVWGNIVSKGAGVDAKNAIATAFDMKAGLEKLNAKWRERGIPELSFGIGINQGEALVGNLGSTEKMEVTVIGDTVNTASRLEGLTKMFGVDMLIGESAAHLVQDKYVLRTVGLIQPKGKTKPMEAFTVLGERTAEATPDRWLTEYEEAVKLYRARLFAEALGKFKKCLEEKPADRICERYIAECETLLKNPPDEHWNGVFVMTEK